MVLNLWTVWCLHWYANGICLKPSSLIPLHLAISGLSLLIIPTITLLKKNLQNLRQYHDSDAKRSELFPYFCIK